ncbi:DUF6527 family protein [Novosphingobium sp. NDB2Meth1]|uniref:DUF6527 family protein n=1 Tax=Novosphingobium sp. NDB2Meth1 TaxID=1892847 RepID=UPI000930E208|nr:DUF6527 family protein [Novosphingobium sp. NDB2Meth1]
MTKLLSPVLAEVSPGYVQWFCPGCRETHHIPVASVHNPGQNWRWDGNPDVPTFEPSVLVRGGHFAPNWKQGEPCWCTPNPSEEDWGFRCRQCHCYVRSGKIEFLADCSHELAGQIVDMVPLAERAQ